jgi:hypothetical protein
VEFRRIYPENNGCRLRCGALTRALVDVRYDVTGVDTSAELLQIARANVPTAHFIHASAYEVPIQNYDAVVAIGKPLTYHCEVADADNLVGAFFSAPPRPYLWAAYLSSMLLDLENLLSLTGLGVRATIGPYWSRQQRTRMREASSETYKFFAASVRLTDEAMKSTASGCLIP